MRRTTEGGDGGGGQALPADSSAQELVGAVSTSPSERLARREEAARLFDALDRLSGDDKKIIELRNFESWSFAEIAREIRISEEAARQRWVRTLKRLRKMLEGG